MKITGQTFTFCAEATWAEWFDVIGVRQDDSHFVEKSAYKPDEQTLSELDKLLRGGKRLASEFTEILKGTPVTFTP